MQYYRTTAVMRDSCVRRWQCHSVCVQSCQSAANCQVVGQPQNLVVSEQSVVLLNACKRRRIASALGVWLGSGCVGMFECVIRRAEECQTARLNLAASL